MTNEEIINQFLNDDETINVLSDEEIIKQYNIFLDYLDSLKPKARSLLAVEPRASSGSFNTSGYSSSAGSPDYFQFSWSQTSQSIENNTTTISWKVTAQGGATSGRWNTSYGGTVTVNGNSYSLKTGTIYNGTVVASGSMTITHNADGSKQFSASINGKIYYSGSSGSTTGSGTFTLNTIPRASTPTLSASSVEMGKQVTIYTNRASSAFTHTIKFDFGSYSETIATGVGASFTYDVQTAMASYVPNATSGKGTFTLYTYNGATLIGTKTVNVTLTVPASIVPAIDGASTTEQNSAVTMGFFVQSQSQIKVVITARGLYGSTITDYSATFEGIAYKGDTFTITSVPTAGDRTLSVTVKDSRGRTTTYNRTISVTAYAKPAINAFNAFRCNASGVEDDGGSYVKFTYNFAITSLSDKNGRDVKIQYKLSTASDWIDLVSLSGYSGNSTYLSGAIFDPNHSYNVRLYVADNFNSTTKQLDIGTEAVTVDYLTGGQGMGLGKVAELEDTLDVAWKVKGRVQIEADGGFSIIDDMNGSQANTIRSTTDPLTFRCFDIYNSKGMPTIYGNLFEMVGRIYHWQAQLLIGADSQVYVRNKGYNDNSFSDWYRFPRINNSTGETIDPIIMRNDLAIIKGKTTDGSVKNLIHIASNNHIYIGYASGLTITFDSQAWLAGLWNVIGKTRFSDGWIGFYNATEDAYTQKNRKAWIGFSGTNKEFFFDIETGGEIKFLKTPVDSGDRVLVSSQLRSHATRIERISQLSGSKNYMEIITPNRSQMAWGVDIWASDKRLKKNIEDTKVNGIEIIKQIHHVSFDWKENDNHESIGYVADEVEEIFPDAVFEVGEDKNKQISNTTITPLISKALQELIDIVENQQKQIDEQNKRLETLEAEILAIKDLIK